MVLDTRCRLVLTLSVLLSACASAKTGGAPEDASVTADAGQPADAMVPLPDAGPVVSTCEICQDNANCPPDHSCVLFGGTRACLPRCSVGDTSCPDGFACGGVETLFCAPKNGLCCIDGDSDTYGLGFQCKGQDCDDDDEDVHPGAVELCNGVDDDCDVITEDGSQDPAVNDACDGADLDLCEEGKLVCDIAAGALVCDDLTADNPDLCNGVDDDCDPTTLDGVADAMVGTACDSSADADTCLDDVYRCNSTVPAVECVDLPGSPVDICDGADNDCNPLTADGSGDPLVGLPCDGIDVDLCEEGTTYCDAATVKCDDPNDVDLEVCDGFDNDCNASTLDGSQDPDVGASCDGTDGDMCLEGNVVCQSGIEICTDNTGTTTELCDGADNDCNGTTDDLDANVVCPGQNPGAGQVAGWSCSGSCSITACTAGWGDVDGTPANGCECGGLDSLGKTCGAATLQSVSLGATVDVTGKLESATDADWVRFDFTNRVAPTTYHPRVEFVDSGGGQFGMDVSGSCGTFATCADGTGQNVNVWEMNHVYTAGAGCCTDGTPHVNRVWIRIYRKNADAPTCASYTIRATNP